MNASPCDLAALVCNATPISSPVRNPKPGNRNLKSGFRNPIPDTRNPKTQSPKSSLCNPKHGTRNPKPKTQVLASLLAEHHRMLSRVAAQTRGTNPGAPYTLLNQPS